VVFTDWPVIGGKVSLHSTPADVGGSKSKLVSVIIVGLSDQCVNMLKN